MINIDIVLLFQVVNFLVLLFLLNILLYKPIRKVLTDRQDEIRASKEKTASVDQEVQEKMARYQEKLREVKAEAAEERNRMLREARDQEAGIIDTARRDADSELSRIQTAIRAESAEAEVYLRAQAQTLSRAICEKVLGRSL
jgi:F-type H+-transporting ATPase subunit b